MIFAHIKNGIVVNCIVVNSQEDLDSIPGLTAGFDLVIRICDRGYKAITGYSYDVNTDTFTPPPPPPLVEDGEGPIE